MSSLVLLSEWPMRDPFHWAWLVSCFRLVQVDTYVIMELGPGNGDGVTGMGDVEQSVVVILAWNWG